MLLNKIKSPKNDIIDVIVNKNNFSKEMFYHLLIWKYLIDIKKRDKIYPIKIYCTKYFEKFSNMNHILNDIETIQVIQIINLLQ